VWHQLLHLSNEGEVVIVGEVDGSGDGCGDDEGDDVGEWEVLGGIEYDDDGVLEGVRDGLGEGTALC